MASLHFVPHALLALYNVREWRNGLAVLTAARPEEWADIVAVMRGFRLRYSAGATPGRRKSEVRHER